MPSANYSSTDIVRDLQQEIIGKKMARGVRLATATELSQRYGVSRRTIERAMVQLIQLGLVERIRGNGTFVRSNTLSFTKKRVCIMTLTAPTNTDISPLIPFAAFDYLNQQLHRELIQVGYEVEHLIKHIKDEGSLSQKERDAYLRKQLDTYDLIVLPAGELSRSEALLRTCKAQKILFMDDIIHPGPWNQIVYDYRPGFQKALRLFRKIGCDKIASVGLADLETSTHRMNAFREEALTMGFSPHNLKEHYVNVSPLYAYLGGEHFAEDYISQRLFDHAILSTSDDLMMGMMSVFRNRGLKPGRDFQLISYDNFESRMKHDTDFQFGVTCITHPLDAMIEAFKTMVQNLGSQRSKDLFYKTYFVPSQELVIRNSTQLVHH